MSDSAQTFFQKAAELEDAAVPFVVVTLVSGRGHIPQDPGAKAIVTAEGIQFGTVGGGKVEAKAILQSIALLEDKSAEPFLATWNLTRDVGMTCGGELTYLFEPKNTSPWNIVVFGAGHVGQAVTRLLSTIPCRVTCVDPRPEWTSKLQRHPRLNVLEHPNPAELVSQFPTDSFFVVVTQGHGTDMPILEALSRFQKKAPYVGAIGSDVKAARIRKDLQERDVNKDFIEKLHCPIGLELGTNHPGEIAVSIVAQLLGVRDFRVSQLR